MYIGGSFRLGFIALLIVAWLVAAPLGGHR